MHGSSPKDITGNLVKLSGSIINKNRHQKKISSFFKHKKSTILTDSFASTVYALATVFVAIQAFIMVIFVLI